MDRLNSRCGLGGRGASRWRGGTDSLRGPSHKILRITACTWRVSRTIPSLSWCESSGPRGVGLAQVTEVWVAELDLNSWVSWFLFSCPMTNESSSRAPAHKLLGQQKNPLPGLSSQESDLVGVGQRLRNLNFRSYSLPTRWFWWGWCKCGKHNRMGKP